MAHDDFIKLQPTYQDAERIEYEIQQIKWHLDQTDVSVLVGTKLTLFANGRLLFSGKARSSDSGDTLGVWFEFVKKGGSKILFRYPRANPDDGKAHIKDEMRVPLKDNIDTKFTRRSIFDKKYFPSIGASIWHGNG